MGTNIRLAAPYQPAPDPLDELLGNRSSLDTPLPVTFFPDRFARTARRETLSLRDLAERSQSTRAPEKDALPLWKLATFGDVRTEKGSLRHDDNLAQITGVEGDHDAGTMTPDEAAERLRAAGIAALVHTTPSHRTGAPRWRVLCPLAQPVAKEARRALVERLNEALGGVLASESFTPSQAFYFGATEWQDAPETHLVDGQPIDRIAPAAAPAPRRETLAEDDDDDPAPMTAGEITQAKSEQAWADPIERARIKDALEFIPADDYYIWAEKVGFALHLASGGSEEGLQLWRQWSRKSAKAAEVGSDAKWQRKWNDFKWNGRRDPVALGSLFDLAKTYGFDPKTPGSHQQLAELLGTSKPAAPLPAESKGEKVGLIRARNGDLKATLHNAVLMLRKVNRDHDYRIRKNDMSGQDEWCAGPINDADLGLIRVAIEQAGMHNVGADLTAGAVRAVAELNRYHPVKDWLESLHHDGTPRLDIWLTRYLGAEDSPYVRAVGRAFLVAMVARVMRPGCKHDHVLVLGGAQGIGKSTACRILGGDWSGDNMPSIRDGAREAGLYLRGHWLVELAELAPSRKAEAEDLKAFLTRATDEIRAPYARRADIVPRQCVFVGTTNETAFLRDASGGRRFWPVTCGAKIETEALATDREQLFAEAVTAYRAGEAWHLPPELERQAAIEQEAAREEHPWELPIREFLDGPTEDPIDPKTRDRVTVAEVLRHLGVSTERQTSANARQVAGILRMFGWSRGHTRTGKAWMRRKRPV